MAAAVSFATPAQAQVPSSAEPSRVGGQIAPMPTTQLPEIGGKIETGGTITAPPGAENVQLVLNGVEIEGQSIYDPVVLSAAYSNMIGKTVTLADVFGIADRLTAKYRNDGYILTQVIVPPQTIDDGRIKLRVVEGYVDQIFFQGNKRGNSSWLEGFAKKIKAAKPLNAKTLERYVLLINDLPGLQARAVLSPSPDKPGASDITIVVEQKLIDGFSQIDNRGTYFLGPLQVNAGVRINNLIGLYEGLNMQVVFAPDNWVDDKPELAFYSFTWQQPLNREGTVLSIGGSFTETHPEYTLTPFDVDGIAKAINVELSHPFIRSRSMNLFTSLKFNFLNTHRNDNLATGGADDRLRVLRAGGTFQFADSLLGINTLTGEVSQGLDVLNASQKPGTFPTRALGEPEFFKVTAEVSRVQRITQHLEAYFAAAGQYSAHALLASEEFGVGGASFGSAYDNSEITGENGFAGRFEMRLNNPVSFQPFLNNYQFYGFTDGGQVYDRDNATPKARKRSLVSAGGGLRLDLNEHFSGSFEVAVPLTAPVATELDKDPRYFGAVSARF